MDDECIYGLVPDHCSTCKHGPAIVPPLRSISSPFAARYDGHCPGCNLPIGLGQQIRMRSDMKWRHEWCDA